MELLLFDIICLAEVQVCFIQINMGVRYQRAEVQTVTESLTHKQKVNVFLLSQETRT